MKTTTIDLTEVYPISAEQIIQFRHDGHILLRGLLPSAEVEHYRTRILEIMGQEAKVRHVLIAPNVSVPLFHLSANLWLKSDEVRELAFAQRFARIAAELMGVHKVRLYHDEAHVKEPGGVATPWHKDQYDWPLATHHTIKLLLALNDICLEMGGVRFASGTHRFGRFPEMPPSYESDELFKQIVHDHHIPVVSYTMHAGDATYHSGHLLHSALPNERDEPREIYAVIYFEDGTRIMEINHEHRRRDLEEFLPGLHPRDVAASPLNPILYSMV